MRRFRTLPAEPGSADESILVSLILGKIYQVVPDARAAKDGLVRIVDESGEDYLFDESQFVFDFPQAVRRKILDLQKAS